MGNKRDLLIDFISALLACLIFALPFMWLWNWLMPMIFGLMKINYLQALGLKILCAFIFKTNIKTQKK